MDDGEQLGTPIEATYEGTSDEDAISDLYADGLTGLSRAATILRVIAIVAALAWVVGVVTIFWSRWNAYVDLNSTAFTSTGSQASNDRLLQTLADTLSATAFYAIVGVLAYGAATFAEARRTALLLAALED